MSKYLLRTMAGGRVAVGVGVAVGSAVSVGVREAATVAVGRARGVCGSLSTVAVREQA
jgi:hypothetical protein